MEDENKKTPAEDTAANAPADATDRLPGEDAAPADDNADADKPAE